MDTSHRTITYCRYKQSGVKLVKSEIWLWNATSYTAYDRNSTRDSDTVIAYKDDSQNI